MLAKVSIVKKRGGKRTKIQRTKVSLIKMIVLQTHAKQHKAQKLTKKLLLQEQIASKDASTTTHTAGTNIPVAEIICDTIPMQIVNFTKEIGT